MPFITSTRFWKVGTWDSNILQYTTFHFLIVIEGFYPWRTGVSQHMRLDCSFIHIDWQLLWPVGGNVVGQSVGAGAAWTAGFSATCSTSHVYLFLPISYHTCTATKSPSLLQVCPSMLEMDKMIIIFVFIIFLTIKSGEYVHLMKWLLELLV